jgi:cyclohexa-1,5-dienecarbonyl-CoA hydratase
MAEKILVEFQHDSQVVHITLNAPKGNVLDSAMMTELHATLESLSGEPQVKLVIFTGAGDHFSFGASVPEHTRELAGQMLKQFHGLFRTLARLSIPTAAVVSGQCLGGGLELALACNFLFVDATARLGQPEIKLGVFAPPASVILPMRIGQTRADYLLLTGISITGEEAVAMGLATKHFDNRDSMYASVEQFITEQILPKSASSLRTAVRAGRHAFNENLLARLERLERLYLDDLMQTHDANEGIASFLERRNPVWTNK